MAESKHDQKSGFDEEKPLLFAHELTLEERDILDDVARRGFKAWREVPPGHCAASKALCEGALARGIYMASIPRHHLADAKFRRTALVHDPEGAIPLLRMEQWDSSLVATALKYNPTVLVQILTTPTVRCTIPRDSVRTALRALATLRREGYLVRDDKACRITEAIMKPWVSDPVIMAAWRELVAV